MNYENIGLKFTNDFISKEYENTILSLIESYKINNPKLVANYGENNYNSIYFGQRYKLDSVPIPKELIELSNKLIDSHYFSEIPFGIAINTYKKGQKIGAHIDKPISGPIVTILSLGSVATMIFKRKNYDNIELELPPRSIVQLRDEIRNDWTHEILPVKDTRYSIIFRSKC